MLTYNFFDRVYEWTYNPPKAFRKGTQKDFLNYRNKIKDTKRFVIHDDIVHSSIQMSQYIDKMQFWMKLAKLPFGKTWIEFDQHEGVKYVHKHGVTQHPYDLDLSDVSEPIGLLFDRLSNTSWQVTQFVEMSDKIIGPRPLTIIFDSEADEATSLNNHSMSISKYCDLPVGIEYACLGITNKSIQKDNIIIPTWINHKLTSTIEPIWQKRFSSLDKKTIRDVILFDAHENRGFLRFIFAMLSTMYKAPTELAERHPIAESRMSGMNRLRYLSGDVVSLKIPKKRQFKSIVKSLKEAYKAEFQIPVRSHQRRYYDKQTGEYRMIDVKDYVKHSDLPVRPTDKSYIVR